MRQFKYAVKLTADKNDGGYVVTCRDLPEVITQGETIEDAAAEAADALEEAIAARIDDGREIPAPSAAKRRAANWPAAINGAQRAPLNFFACCDWRVHHAKNARNGVCPPARQQVFRNLGGMRMRRSHELASVPRRVGPRSQDLSV